MVGGVHGIMRQIVLYLVEEVNLPSGVHVMSLAPVVVVVTVRVKMLPLSPVILSVAQVYNYCMFIIHSFIKLFMYVSMYVYLIVYVCIKTLYS